MTDHLTYRDLARLARQEITAVLATDTLHPPLLLHLAENVLQELEGYLVTSRNFPSRNRLAVRNLQQGKQCQQGIVGFIRYLQRAKLQVG